MGLFKSREFRINVELMTNRLCLKGCPPSEAKKIAKTIVVVAERTVAGRTVDNSLNPMTGARLLSTEGGRLYFQEAAKEGVTREDICEWWDIDPLTRECLQEEEFADRIATYELQKKSGKTEEQAAFEVNLLSPLYGRIEESHIKMRPEDRPLPRELGPRIGRFLAHQSLIGLMDEIKKAGSCNAFIRIQIKAGKV